MLEELRKHYEFLAEDAEALVEDDPSYLAYRQIEARSEFIALAFQAMPALLEAVEALEACQTLINVALPRFNWGASVLDADAIKILNEVPGQVRRALEKLK